MAFTARFRRGFQTARWRQIRVIDAIERVTDRAVAALISCPFYNSSAMDGYALRFADTFGASEKTPMKLAIGKETVYVDTGDPIPVSYVMTTIFGRR